MLISMELIWEPSLGAIRPLACRAMGPLASREAFQMLAFQSAPTSRSVAVPRIC
jgi:hypothetical protein